MNPVANQLPDPARPLIISYLSLRKFLGILGGALPLVSVSGTFLFGHCKTVLPSISQYYYSAMGDFLVGALCGVAVFLFSYRGYDKWDRILTNAAGLFAVLSAFFPTHLDKTYIQCYYYDRDCTDLSSITHLVSSGLFFITLAILSIFLFTKTNGKITPQKKVRNKIYRVCGYVMLGAVLLIGLYRIPFIHSYFEKYKPIFYLEALALLAFSFSWLTKGEVLLKDE